MLRTVRSVLGSRRSALIVTGELAASFREAAEAAPSAAEVDWYAKRLPRESGTVLDGMAGTGRLALALAERGFHVHGSDDSAAMVALCEARFTAAARQAAWFRQELPLLNVPFRYAAALVAQGGFQRLVEPHAAAAALQRLRAHLVEPGRLLLELVIPAHARHPPGAPIVEVQRVRLEDGSSITLRSEISVDVERRRIERHDRYERRSDSGLGGREDERVTLTWYTEEEALALVKRAGYRNARVEPFPASGDAEEDERGFGLLALL